MLGKQPSAPAVVATDGAHDLTMRQAIIEDNGDVVIFEQRDMGIAQIEQCNDAVNLIRSNLIDSGIYLGHRIDRKKHYPTPAFRQRPRQFRKRFRILQISVDRDDDRNQA